MIIVLIAIFLLIPHSKSAPCPFMCQCAGNLCQYCYHDFTYDAQYTYYPTDVCECPKGYYLDSSNKFCKFCDIKCAECISETVCIICEDGYLQIDGKCIKEEQSNKRIQFAHDFSPQNIDSKKVKGMWIQNQAQTNDFDNYFDSYFCQQLDQNLFGHYYFDYNTYIIKTYYGLPFHQYAKLKIQYVIIDQWIQEQFTIQIERSQHPSFKTFSQDLTPLKKDYLYDYTQRNGYSFCNTGGPKYDDSLGTYNYSFPHQTSSLKIRIRSSRSEQGQINDPSSYVNGMYFAIKDILLIIGTCPKGCTYCDGTYCNDQCQALYKYDYTQYICICDTDIAILTSQGQCIAKCLANEVYLQSKNRCITCIQLITGCETCTSSTCNECKQGMFRYEGKCVTNCPSQFYETFTSQYVCSQCDQFCLNCEKGYCKICADQYYLYQGSCYEQCPDGTYENQYSHSCQRCHKNCQTCDSLFECTQCKTDLPSITYELFEEQCIQICKITQQINLYDSQCSNNCGTNCLYCLGQNDNQCTVCQSPYVLQDYTCINSCSLGKFQLGGKCIQCLLKCQQCTKFNLCTKCSQGYWLYQSDCYLQCPTGYFQKISDRTCQQCGDNCNMCYDDNICQHCKHGYVLINGICQQRAPCQISQYYNYQLDACISCPQFCESCYKDLCQTCQDGKYLNNGRCVIQCPQRKHADLETMHCLWNDPLCEIYNEVQGICQQCKSLNPPLILSQDKKSCLYSCSEGLTKNSIDDHAQIQCTIECPASCSQCSSDLTCIKCMPGLLLIQGQNPPCQSQCPSGYRSDSIQCISCPSGCIKCQQNGQCTQCQIPDDGRTLTLNQDGYCVQTGCQYSYKNIAATGSCIMCSQNCLTCTQVPEQCTSCSTEKYLLNNYCYTKCPGNHYEDDISKTCLACLPQCSSCISLQQCNSCEENYILFEGNCLYECPHGYFLQFQAFPMQIYNCTKCSINCQTCYGQSQYQCLTCYQGYILDDNKCVQRCPINKYEDIFGHCDQCSYLCDYCYGPGSFQCLNCSDGAYILDGYCYQSCPVYTYYNTLTQRCQSCAYGCISCTNYDNCTSCDNNFYLYKNRCEILCPTKTYYNFEDDQCDVCQDSMCQECTSSGCTRCIHPYFRHDKNCTQVCPLGTYQAYHNLRQCLNCPKKCIQCTRPNDCKRCKGNMILTNGICLPKCRNSTYYDEDSQNCQACTQSQCNLCVTKDQCSKCNEGFYLHAQSCLQNCPIKFYADQLLLQCLPCYLTCSSCQYNRFNCTECQDGYVLKSNMCVEQVQPDNCGAQCSICADSQNCFVCAASYFLNQNFQCVIECNDGYYESQRQCLPCSMGCQICSTNQSCHICSVGNYLLRNTCVVSCPPGMFQMIHVYQYHNQYECQFCSQGCLVCMNKSECYYCNSGYILFDGFCQNDCPQGFYLSEQQCQKCSLGCLNCYNQSQCRQCSTGYMLYKGMCINNTNNTCPAKYFKLQDNQCQVCRPPCLTCSDLNTCQSCISDYSLHLFECLEKCPKAFYAKNVSGFLKCQPCSASCRTCIVNSTTCSSCQSGHYLYGNRCLIKCPIGTFEDDQNQVCRKCSSFCLNCQTFQSCNICHLSMMLYQGYCLENCPFGYTKKIVELDIDIYNKIGAICEKCSSPCLTCTQQSIYNCTSCLNSYYLINGRCLQHCPKGYYSDIQKGLCRQCQPSCQTCTYFYQCTTCQFGINQATGVCLPQNICPSGGCQQCSEQCQHCYQGQCFKCYDNFYLLEGSCVNQCPLLYYKDDTTGQCILYPQQYHCQYGQGLSNCLKCQENYYYYQGVCYQECPQYMIPKIGEQSNQCMLNYCLSFNTTNCTSCMAPYYAFNGSCVNNCPQGYYKTTSGCNACLIQCLNCTSLTNCTQCRQGYYHHFGKCLRQCPMGFYSNTDKCYQCKQQCLFCSPYNQCTQCHIGLYLINGQCKQQCPHGYAESATDKKCYQCQLNCLQCSSLYNCQQCHPDYYLVKGQCVSYCYLGYYQHQNSIILDDSIMTMKQCLPCKTNCMNCSATQCYACDSAYFLYKGVCVSICRIGTFQYYNNTIMQCKQCQSPCYDCIQTSKTCLSCIENFYLFGTQCRESCPTGYYAHSFQCRPCHYSCKQCLENQCTTCKDGYNLENGKCISICSSIYQYYDNLNLVCRSCSSECLQCYGPRYNQCLSCRYPLILSSSVCVSYCSSNLQFDELTYTCAECPIQCITCQFSNSQLHCLQCIDGLYLMEYLPGLNECLKQCPDGYYQYSHDGTCQSCSQNIPSCLDCKANILTGQPTCIYCEDNKILNLNGRCIDRSQCLPYQMIIIDEICKYCSQNCLECILDNNQQEECILCLEGYSLDQNKICVENCPFSSASIDVTNINSDIAYVCQQCQQNCVICNDIEGVDQGTICQQCASNYYLDLQNNLCRIYCADGYTQIETPIKYCTLQIDYIQKCDSNNYYTLMDTKECVENCPNGYYYQVNLDNQNLCYKCKPQCLSCSSQNSCIQCLSGLFMIQPNTCVVSCPSTHFVRNNRCVPCISPCASCAQSSILCTSCIIDQSISYYLFENSCVITCPDGYYQDVSKCVKCPTKCKTCTTNGQCSQCSNIYYTAPGCTDNSNMCTSIQYLENPGDCQNCHYSCQTCFGPTEFQCLTCATGILLDSQCKIECPSGFIESEYSDPIKCIECSFQIPFCQECQESNIQTYQCVSCKSNFILHQNSCLRNCSQLNNGTYIFVLSNGICISCPQFCMSCIQGQCISCLGDKMLQKHSDGNNYCVDACSVGFFQATYASTKPECYPCHLSCLTCDNAGTCLTCQNTKVLYQGLCVNDCPSSYFLDYTSTQCLPCNDYLSNKCAKCQNIIADSNQPKCTECIQPYLTNSEGLCLQCLDGYYLTSSKQCFACNYTCQTCTSLACLTCRSGYLLSGSKCVIQCPISTYRQLNSCVSCSDPNCIQCDENICYQCKGQYGLYEGGCMLNCPDQTIKINKQCVQCEEKCQACQSQTKCNECQVNYLLFDGDCLSVCPYGYTSDSNFECITCRQGCLQCSNQANTCNHCLSGLTNNNDGTCSYQSGGGSCSNGEYQLESNCYPCDESCTECSNNGPNNCLQCYQGFRLTNSKYCISICPSHQYYSSGSSSCQQCSAQCAQCINSPTECRTCPQGKVLSQSNACQDSCSSGTYISNKICYSCPSFCQTCTSSTKCSTCKAGITIFYKQMCYLQCPDQSYSDSLTSCAPCPPKCLSCTSSSDCQSCKYPYNLYYNSQLGQNQCIDNCPVAYYPYENQCLSCPFTDCTQCNNTQCFECLSDKKLYNGNCQNICPDQYYANSNNICQQCSSPCVLCQFSSTLCKTCQSQFLLLQIQPGYGQCVQECPQGYEEFEQNCTPVACANCSICIDNQCQRCLDGFYKYEGLCQDSCIETFYGNQTTLSCQQCIDNCLECPNSTHCITCIPEFNFTQQFGCVQQQFIQFGVLSNMSGFTSNITEITSMTYLVTSAGPIIFGQMTNTYFNIQLCQFFFFHEGATQNNEQIDNFLQSLSYMSLSSGISSFDSRRRMLLQAEALNFLQVNVPIFIIFGTFLALYLIIYIIQKNINNCCVSCPNLNFYIKQICAYMRKRFKWIYFDFVMWLSFLPFLYFGLLQVKKFNFDSAIEGVSSLLALLFVIVYPLYPIFITYQIKKNYKEICKETNQLIQMSFNPWLSKVKRPQVLQADQQFKYLTKDNFRLIYYPLKYFRKFLFVLVVALCPVPIATLSILIGLNVLFIIYMAILRPRKMPYMIFDFVVEGILLAFQIFLMVYVSFQVSNVNAMSIVTHVVGFITANLSIIIAIILNIVAYYHIFMCIYGLVKHLRERMEEKEKNGFKEDSSNSTSNKSPRLNPDDLMVLEKQNVQADLRTQDLSDEQRKIAHELSDKDLIINKIQPKYNISEQEYKNLFGDKDMQNHFKKQINDNITEDMKTQNLSDEQRNIAHFLDDKDLIMNGIKPKYHDINFENQGDLFRDKEMLQYYRNQRQGNIFNDKDLQMGNEDYRFNDDNLNISNNRYNVNGNHDLFQDKQLFQNANNKYKVYGDSDEQLPSMKQKKKKKNKNKKKQSRKNLLENRSQISEQHFLDNNGNKQKLKGNSRFENDFGDESMNKVGRKKIQISTQRNNLDESQINLAGYYVGKKHKSKEYSPQLNHQKMINSPIKQRHSNSNVKEQEAPDRSGVHSVPFIEVDGDSRVNLIKGDYPDNSIKDQNMKERTINKNRKNLDDFDTFLQDNDQNNIEELQGKNRLKTKTNTNKYYKEDEDEDQIKGINFYNRKKNKNDTQNDIQLNKDPSQVGLYNRKNKDKIKTRQLGKQDDKQFTNIQIIERKNQQANKKRSIQKDINEAKMKDHQTKGKNTKIQRNMEDEFNEIEQASFKRGKNSENRQVQQQNYYNRSQKQRKQGDYDIGEGKLMEREPKKGKYHQDQLQQGQFKSRTLKNMNKNSRKQYQEANLEQGNFRQRQINKKNSSNKIVGDIEDEIDEGLLVSRKPTSKFQKSTKNLKQQKQLEEAKVRERENKARQQQPLRFTRGRADVIEDIDEGLMMSVNPKTRQDFRKNTIRNEPIYQQAEQPQQLQGKQRQKQKKQGGFFSNLFGLGKSDNDNTIEQLQKQKSNEDAYFEGNFYTSRNRKSDKSTNPNKKGDFSMKMKHPDDESFEDWNRPSKRINNQQGKFNIGQLNINQNSRQFEEDQSPSRNSKKNVNQRQMINDQGLKIVRDDDSFEDDGSPKRMRKSRVQNKKKKKGTLNLNQQSNTFNQQDDIVRKQKSQKIPSSRRPKNSSLHIQKRQDIDEEDIEEINL